MIGGTCFHLSPTEAGVACSENKVIFWSSFYNYKWSEVLDRAESESTCSVTKGGLSAVFIYKA